MGRRSHGADVPEERNGPYWFEYGVSVGRVSARPIHWLGWFALLACISLSVALSLLVGPPLAVVSPALAIAGMFAATALPILLLLKLVKSRGRRRR